MKDNPEYAQMTTRWMRGIPYEVAFWNNTYRWNRAFEGLMRWSHYGSTIRLEGFDANRYLSALDNPVVLDIGAGMSYAPGNQLSIDGRQVPLDIHYIDPLAPYFNRILRCHRREMPNIEFGMMEYLSAFFPEGNVALAIIQNALDHSALPLKGIYEALEVLRLGGILYLNHHPNEAEAECYKGFHQWNIIEEYGALVIWNQSVRYHISDLLRDFAEVSLSRGEGGHVIAVIRKTADVPRYLTNTKGDQRALCELLLAQSVEHASLWHNVRRTLTYWKYNAIQFVAQSLPLDRRMQLKRLLTWKRTSR